MSEWVHGLGVNVQLRMNVIVPLATPYPSVKMDRANKLSRNRSKWAISGATINAIIGAKWITR